MKAFISVSGLIGLHIFSLAQDKATQLKSIEQRLSSGQQSVTQILTDPSYMPLHSKSEFRELIKHFAKQEKITMVTVTEPGTRITIKGKIVDNNGKLLSNVLVYVYHTDNKGWYSDTGGHVLGMGGDRGHARLFGYFKTNNDGSFEFHTIHPQGYPNSDLPQHIHLEVFSNTGQSLIVTELLFNGDPRLTSSMREHMSNEGAIIASNTGTKNAPLYNYEIKIK